MISSRSQQVRDLLIQVRQQESYDQRKKNLEDAQQAVDEVILESDRLYQLFLTLSTWLDQALHQYIREEMLKVQEKLRDSRQQFLKQRVVKTLNDQREAIKARIKELEAFWKVQAETALKPYRETLQLLSGFPELSIALDNAKRLETKLARAVGQIPKTAVEVKAFNDDLVALDAELSNLPGLTTPVLEFLKKARDGQATLADLDPTVLAWCIQYPTHFRIRLG